MPLNTENYQQTTDLLKSWSTYDIVICDFAVPITDRRRLLTAEARVHARTRPCEFYDRHVAPAQVSTIARYSSI